VLCQACARSQHQAGTQVAPAVAATIQDAPAATSDEAANANAELLQQLRALPAAFPRSPMMWIPRRAKQQIASILREKLAEATRLANAPPGNDDAERAHLLCRAAPQLLLRAPEATEDHEADYAAGAKNAALVRQRVQLALQGKWAALVEQCAQDLRAAEQRLRAMVVQPRVRGSPEEQLPCVSSGGEEDNEEDSNIDDEDEDNKDEWMRIMMRMMRMMMRMWRMMMRMMRTIKKKGRKEKGGGDATWCGTRRHDTT